MSVRAAGAGGSGAAAAAAAEGRVSSARGSGAPGRTVLLLSLAHRVLVLLALTLLLPAIHVAAPFDSSSLLLAAHPPRSLGLHAALGPLVRWDAVHFLEIAHGGYTLEHLFAFQPALPALLRWSGSLLRPSYEWNASQAVLFASLASALAATLSPWLLYHVTLKHTAAPAFSFLAALLSILSPAPATLVTPSPEAFFSTLVLLGLLALAPPSAPHKQSSWTYSARLASASLAFATATAFRANGIVLAGYIAYSLFWERQSKVVPALLRLALSPLILLPTVPFIAFQYWAKEQFCQAAAESSRPWCASTVPAIYHFVQREYWNVGFLRYWEPAQAPNFLLAAPVLLLSVYGTAAYTSSAHAPIVRTLLSLGGSTHTASAARTKAPPGSQSPRPRSRTTFGFGFGFDFDFESSPTLLPHVLHNALTAALLLLVSHVQIALRFASAGGMPVVWWGAAAWVLNGTGRRTGKSDERAVRWERLGVLLASLVMWNVLSLTLYSAFYPPA